MIHNIVVAEAAVLPSPVNVPKFKTVAAAAVGITTDVFSVIVWPERTVTLTMIIRRGLNIVVAALLRLDDIIIILDG